jgi:hypothetical protein
VFFFAESFFCLALGKVFFVESFFGLLSAKLRALSKGCDSGSVTAEEATMVDRGW